MAGREGIFVRNVEAAGSTAAVRERVFANVAQGMTAKEFLDFKEQVNSVPDAEFMEVITKLQTERPNIPLKDILTKQMNKQRDGVVPYEESATHVLRAQFASDELTKRIKKRMAETEPSDVIHLDRESDIQITDLWTANDPGRDNKAIFIPSDLFFAKTIPLQDVRIIVDERGSKDWGDAGMVVSYRVVIFEDYQKLVDEADDKGQTYVGAVIDETMVGLGFEYFIPFSIIHGFHSIITPGCCWYGANTEIKRTLMDTSSHQELSDAFIDRMATWYGIQIALLHPLVQTVFSKPRPVKNRKAVLKPFERETRRVKYIRTHNVTGKAVSESLESHGLDPEIARKFTRRTLVWYVIGFWRDDPSKGKIFVKGHWRGPLKDLKKNLDKVRERDIAQLDKKD
jgi:hypothetical protein